MEKYSFHKFHLSPLLRTASLPAFEDIMVPNVVVVEDETAFLPCIRTQAEDIKVQVTGLSLIAININ